MILQKNWIFFLQQKLELLMIMANKVNFKSNNKGSGVVGTRFKCWAI